MVEDGAPPSHRMVHVALLLLHPSLSPHPLSGSSPPPHHCCHPPVVAAAPSMATMLETVRVSGVVVMWVVSISCTIRVLTSPVHGGVEPALAWVRRVARVVHTAQLGVAHHYHHHHLHHGGRQLHGTLHLQSGGQQMLLLARHTPPL